MKIVTSLSFQGQCREAFEFYAKVLGGKITAAMPYGDGRRRHLAVELHAL